MKEFERFGQLDGLKLISQVTLTTTTTTTTIITTTEGRNKTICIYHFSHSRTGYHCERSVVVVIIF